MSNLERVIGFDVTPVDYGGFSPFDREGLKNLQQLLDCAGEVGQKALIGVDDALVQFVSACQDAGEEPPREAILRKVFLNEAA